MNEHVKVGRHVEIGEAQSRLPELVAAALRGEEVVVSVAGAPQVRLVPVETASDVEDQKIIAQRQAALGMYKHLVKTPIPDIRDLKMTDAELDAREREKFADLR